MSEAPKIQPEIKRPGVVKGCGGCQKKTDISAEVQASASYIRKIPKNKRVRINHL